MRSFGPVFQPAANARTMVTFEVLEGYLFELRRNLPVFFVVLGFMLVNNKNHAKQMKCFLLLVLVAISWHSIDASPEAEFSDGIKLNGVEPHSEKPNIILLLSDDQSWNGLSLAMHPQIGWSKSRVIETPNIEKLASEGMRFSAAYAPASVCAPTRVSIQTGKSPAALHWTKASGPEYGHKMIEPLNVRNISHEETTIGEQLRDAGYATAHFGKWHLNGGGPNQNGYDVGDGDIGNEYAHQYADPNPADLFGMTRRAISFMENRKVDKKPFFMQMSWHALHAPQNAMKATLTKYAERLNRSVDDKRVGSAAISENLDTAVGLLMESIDRLGFRNNTFVVYMSDNGAGGGGKGDNQGIRDRLAGGKGGVWEGGIRCPFIIRGPGIPADSWCHTRIVGYDLFPTFCAWAGIPAEKLPKGLEGGSIQELLDDGLGKVYRSREELIFHFPHYQGGDGPHSALFLDHYKLIKFYEDNRLALFDIDQDIVERHNLFQQFPVKARELEGRLDNYLNEIDAQMAVPNPQYDPENAVNSAKSREGRSRAIKSKRNQAQSR